MFMFFQTGSTVHQNNKMHPIVFGEIDCETSEVRHIHATLNQLVVKSMS